jgi:hypothetical protein
MGVHTFDHHAACCCSPGREELAAVHHDSDRQEDPDRGNSPRFVHCGRTDTQLPPGAIASLFTTAAVTLRSAPFILRGVKIKMALTLALENIKPKSSSLFTDLPSAARHSALKV